MRACARALFRRAETPIVAVRGRLELVKSIEDACWCLCTARRATCLGPRFVVWRFQVALRRGQCTVCVLHRAPYCTDRRVPVALAMAEFGEFLRWSSSCAVPGPRSGPEIRDANAVPRGGSSWRIGPREHQRKARVRELPPGASAGGASERAAGSSDEFEVGLLQGPYSVTLSFR